MKNHFVIPVAFFLIVIIVAHFFPPPYYQWQENTISELASQGHDNAWIMRGGFIGFGVLLALSVAAYGRQPNHLTMSNVFIASYGIAILLSGIFSTAPFNPTITYSLTEAKLHSLFATIAGVSISMAVVWRIFFSRQPSQKLLHLGFLILIIGLSLAFGLAENEMLFIGKGIIQRLLYITGFIWLIIVGYLQCFCRLNLESLR